MAVKKTSKKKTTNKKAESISHSKLDELIRQVNKEVGEDIVATGFKNYEYERIPFTSPRMNYCTFGGLPIGRLIEFYGPEHGGKTTTLCDAIANYQNTYPNRRVVIVDAENTFDLDWAEKLGVDISKITLFQPTGQGAEFIFQFIEDAVKTGEVGMWALDSIGALVSNKEIDDDIEDKTYAGISQPLTKFAKRINPLMNKYHCLGIAINQERDNIGNPYAPPITPGGRAWKYLCSVRLRFNAGKYVDDKGNEISKNSDSPAGQIIQMVMTKNKTCPPTRRTGFYTLNYDYGIDYIKDLVDVAIQYDIIHKHGAWFDIVDINTGEVLAEKIQGQANLYGKIEDDIDLLKAVEKMVDKKSQ